MDNSKIYDFLVENNFKDWALGNGGENHFWENWINESPENARTAEEYKLLLQKIHAAAVFPTASMQKEAWENLQLNLKRKNITDPVPVINIFKPWARIAAAVALLLITAAGLFYFMGPSQTRVETSFGEIKIITLPDGSKITLNSNSVITYGKKNWKVGHDREVKLHGEAFFEINEQGQVKRDKFTVHTGGVDVEVLGTKFNVNNFRELTKVVLQSGKVKLSSRGAGQSPVYMQPGEKVNFDSKRGRFKIEKVNPAIYSSWKDNKFIFENTTLHEIALMIEDKYGLKVNIISPGLASRKVSGEILIGGKETLFKALETLYQLKITVKGNDEIIISGHQPNL